MKMQDQQLLSEYRRTRSQRAFAELVRRYADVVYAAARRQVKVPAMAEDAPLVKRTRHNPSEATGYLGKSPKSRRSIRNR